MVLSATKKTTSATKLSCNKCFLTRNRLETSSTYGRQQTPVNPKGIARPFQETGFF
jgi:hypothetical protein